MARTSISVSLKTVRIFKDSAIYLAGELIAKALPFLLLPYLTRKFGVEGFGELSYYQTIYSILVLTFGLSQEGALPRYFYFYGTRNLPNVMLAGYSYTAICTTIALGVAVWKHSIVLAAVALAASSQTILAVQLAYRQCQKRAISYTIIQLSSSVLANLLTILLLELTDTQPIAMRFAAFFVGNIIVSIAAYCCIPKNKNTFNFRRIWLSSSYILAFGVPLVLHHASNFIKGQLDRIVIYEHYSAAQLGVYAAAVQLVTIVSLLLMAVNKATVPYYFQALKVGDLNAKKVRKMAWLSLLLIPIFVAMALPFPEQFFLWVLGSQYVGVKYYILWFLLGSSFAIPYYILVNFLFYHGRNKRISMISVLSTIIYLSVLIVCARMGIKYIPLAGLSSSIMILPILYYYVQD